MADDASSLDWDSDGSPGLPVIHHKVPDAADQSAPIVTETLWQVVESAQRVKGQKVSSQAPLPAARSWGPQPVAPDANKFLVLNKLTSVESETDTDVEQLAQKLQGVLNFPPSVKPEGESSNRRRSFG